MKIIVAQQEKEAAEMVAAREATNAQPPRLPQIWVLRQSGRKPNRSPFVMRELALSVKHFS